MDMVAAIGPIIYRSDLASFLLCLELETIPSLKQIPTPCCLVLSLVSSHALPWSSLLLGLQLSLYFCFNWHKTMADTSLQHFFFYREPLVVLVYTLFTDWYNSLFVGQDFHRFLTEIFLHTITVSGTFAGLVPLCWGSALSHNACLLVWRQLRD